MTLSAGGRFEGSIEALAFGGDGVAHAPDGRTAFVPYAAVGDRAEFEVLKAQKTFVRAGITKLLANGPGRVDAPCPVFAACGGCQWQHLAYEAQLAAKQNFTVESLRRIGGIPYEDLVAEHVVKAILPSPDPFHYRNKAMLPVADGHFGFYRESSHDIVELPAQGCAIQSAATNAVLSYVRERAALLPGLKHVAVRSNSKGETLLALVTAAPIEVDARPWMIDLAGLVGVVNNVQPLAGNTVFGRETRLLAGEEFLTEDLDGLRFRLSATSFFQVNPAQTLKLWQLLKEVRLWTGKEEVLELYCGVGTLSLPLARLAGRLVGIENWMAAVDDAKFNAKLNGMKNLSFDVSDSAQGFAQLPHADLIVVDPPRKGLSPEVSAGITASQARELIYVACDPASLARDLKGFLAAGWQLQSVQPLDMFPQTYHVENLVRLQR